jgi:hypothetical protein
MVAAVVFAASCSGDLGGSRESRSIVEMEQSLVLPPEALPLDRYDRFYAFEAGNVEGVLILSESPNGKARSVPKAHLPLERRDGGCGVIRVTYDRRTSTWTSVVCNQRA